MKKGFISSSLVYTFLIMFLFITLAIITYDLNKEKLLGYIVNEAKDEIKSPNTIPSILVGDVFGYDYTGSPQTFTAPKSGIYQIELWGASGGSAMTNMEAIYRGGYGGYTSGSIYLKEGTELYIYVGEAGKNGATGATIFEGGAGGWNGGGKGGDDANHDSAPDSGGGGGGATDIRLISGSWDNINSLRSRIMVAGGGGGSVYWGTGGEAGGLNGLIGYVGTSSISPATQTSGHAFGIGKPGLTNDSGTGGGGGGYYGGLTTTVYTAGGGGSSFISGHPGCNAIDGSGEHTSDPTHISGQIFFNTIMIDGSGTAWKTAAVDLMQMPKPDGAFYEWGAGHTGNGFAKITYIATTDYSSFDVQNYSNNGLVLMYDGIHNGGIGIHNDNSSANKAVWKDLSGNNNDATLSNFGFTSSSGWLDNALRFDGNDDIVQLVNKLINLFKGSATIEMVVQFDELLARDVLFGNYSGTTSDINWEKHNANQSRFYWNGGYPDTQTTAIFNHLGIMQTSLVFDRNNSIIKILVNGVERHSNTDSRYTTDTLDFSAAYIGRDSRTDETALKGNIYNVRVYNRVLTSSEIMHNLLIDKARFGF